MKNKRVGKRVEVLTPSGIKLGRVIKEFTEIGGENHNKKFVAIVLDDPSLNMYESEVVYHISEIKLLD